MRTVALAAARRGYRLAVGYRTTMPARRAVAAAVARRAAGDRLAADIADEAAVVRLFATVDRELGRLSGLVNSAGIIGPTGGSRRSLRPV